MQVKEYLKMSLAWNQTTKTKFYQVKPVRIFETLSRNNIGLT